MEKNCKSNDCEAGIPSNCEIAVILLVGLPASGKSTLARKLQQRVQHPNGNGSTTCDRTETFPCRGVSRRLVHIEYDGLEDSLLHSLPEGTERMVRDNGDKDDDENGNRRRDAWNQARQKALEEMELEIQGARNLPTPRADDNSLPNGSTSTTSDNNKYNTVILMDDNFYLRGMRKQIHRLLLGHRPIRFGILYLESKVEVCLERNQNRTEQRRVPDDIIAKMSAILEPPRAAWEVESTLTIVDGEKSIEEVVDFINQCPVIVELPPDPDSLIDPETQATDRAKTRENQCHNLDKLLRSFVGRVAKYDKTFGKTANTARKKVMQEFKSGDLEFTTVDNNDGCVAKAFLDLVVPTPTDGAASTGNNTDSMESTLRLELEDILNNLRVT